MSTQNTKGKLIVVEGVDASGKATQAKLLGDRLRDEGYNVMQISFPNYDSPASFMVKEYLRGAFGENPNSIPPKLSSTFFAIDRYYSYHEKGSWGEHLNNGGIVIADRYTTSNMVHQMSKYDNDQDKLDYIAWLKDFEYGLYGLPKPDEVLFLDMPPKYGAELKKGRALKNQQDKDIHEDNIEYLTRSYNQAVFVADSEKWTVVHCVEKGQILSITDINDKLLTAAKVIL